jgi:DNA-binding NarL/FixJ family response regulator
VNKPLPLIPFFVEKRDAQRSQPVRAADHLGVRADAMKVFVVDDSTIIRERLKRMLAAEPDIQTIGETGDAHQAIVAIRSQMPDVVLLDIHLLGGNGIEVLQQVKRAQPSPAVIILTDYPYPEYREQCMTAGADYFFVKSTEFDQVVPALYELNKKAHASPSSDHTSRRGPQCEPCSMVESTTLPILMT